MTSKQRATLRALASQIEPIYQIGKGNISDTLIRGVDEALEKRELVKISVLKGSDYDAKEVLEELSSELNAEQVCSIGNKVVLYRRSKSDKVKHIEF